MSDICKTVKVKPSSKEQGDFVVINEEDFDPKVHTLAKGESAPEAAKIEAGQSVFDPRGAEAEEASADEIVAAIADLDPDNDEHWTKGGLPDVSSLANALGKKVTRAAIDEAAPDARRAE